MKATQKRKHVFLFTFFFALVSVFILFSQTDFASADNCNFCITQNDCERVGEYWLEQNYNDGTVVSEVVPILNSNDVCAYCVEFEKDGEPNGYIVIDADIDSQNYLIEFSLSGKSIYDSLIENSGVSFENDNKALYSLGGYDYAISLNLKNTEFYSTTNQFFSNVKLREVWNELKYLLANKIDRRTPEAKKNYYEGFFNSNEVITSGYNYREILYATTFYPSVMSEFRNDNDFTGNCTPTAAANIMNYYREKRGFSNLGMSRQKVYDKIVSNSGWNRFGNEGMSLSVAGRGMSKLASSSGYKYGSATYWFNLWSDYKRDIDNGFPILLALYGNKLTDGVWKSVGHSVVAVGYLEYEKGPQYLRIYDGWYRTPERFVWFNSDYFTSKTGVCIKLS